MVHAAGACACAREAPGPRNPLDWLGIILDRCDNFATNFASECGSNGGCSSSGYEYASKGASMRMRLIAVLAVLMASFTLGGCFFHHNQTVMTESEALPPLK
jgi:hypothetical protein